jgi:hypothetical protein
MPKETTATNSNNGNQQQQQQQPWMAKKVGLTPIRDANWMIAHVNQIRQVPYLSS